MSDISRTVVVIDDNLIDQMIAQKMIENVIPGLSFVFFQQADEAFKFIQSGKCKDAIVLLDLDLPIFTGFDFLEELDKSNFYLPIYILSVLTREIISMERKENVPVKGIFQKPLSGEDILNMARDNHLLPMP